MDKFHKQTDIKLEEMEKHISSIYSRTYKETSEKWVEYLKKAEKKADSLLKAVSIAKTPEEKAKAERQYKAYLRSVTLQNKRYKEMVEQTANRLLAVNETALQYINEQLPEVYVINHNGLAGVIEKDLVKEGVQGVSFTMVDGNTVKKLATTNATLLPYKYINGKKDVRWNTKKINAEVLQGILQGESINTISKRLETVQDMNRVSAVRNARTMVTSAENSGRLAVFEEAERRGLKFGKVWLATNDKRTRHAHSTLDGVIVEDWHKPFETVLWLSKNKRQADSIMYPGDPSAHPANVYNCRCSLGYEYLGVIENANNDTTENLADVKELNAKTTFTPAQNIKEAETFIQQYVDDKQFGALGVSYKGIDVEVANEINKAFARVFDTFNVNKFGGIIAPAANTKYGKLIENATAAYSPIRNSFLLNRKSMKNIKTATKAFEAEHKALNDLLYHPEKYDFTKLSKKAIATVERSKISGRATVPESIEQTLWHEVGHMLEKQIYKMPEWTEAENNMPKYADKISGYAGENRSEYIAESFTSYLKGESVTDPVLISIFEKLKR